MNPTLSVIIPTYNSARYLAHAVDSVLEQTFSDLECIIVDDGSHDDTAELARSLVEKDARVRYFYKDNAGAYVARNFGLRQAQGEWVQHLDADDWLHPDKIRFQLSHLEGLPAPGGDVVFYSDYQLVYQDERGEIVDRVTRTVGPLDNQQLLERAATWDLTPDFPLVVHGMLTRRTVYDKRMFEERLKHFADIEFEVDLLLRGVPFVYTPIVGAFYRQHGSTQMTRTPEHHEHYVTLLEFLHAKDRRLMWRNPRLEAMVRRAFMARDARRFNRLARLIDLRQTPVTFSNDSIRVRSMALLKLMFWARLLVPATLPKALAKVYRRLSAARQEGRHA